MVGFLSYIVMLAFVVMPSAVFAQSVVVDLSVLDALDAPPPAPVLAPVENDTAIDSGHSFMDVGAMRRKYRAYPFVGADAAWLQNTPLPIAKPAVVFKPIPRPPVKVASVPVPVVEEPLVVEAARLPPVDVSIDDVFDVPPPSAAGLDLTEAIDITAPIDESLTAFVDNGTSPAAEKQFDGFRVTAIGYSGGDIRLNDAVANAMNTEFIPEIKANADKRLGLYAYASSDERGERKARRLSLSRALELRSFLITAGVAADRIDIFALGDTADGTFKDRVDLVLQD